MGHVRGKPAAPDEYRSVRRRSRGPRVPAWVAFPLAALAGYAGAGWLGLVVGAVIGFFLWRSRA